MLNKEQFTKYMEELKSIVDQEDALHQALSTMSPDFGGFSNEKAITLITNLLKTIMNDNDPEYPNIDYFIYELEWGTKYKEGCITLGDGTPIPLATISDLYELLVVDYNNRKENERA